MKQKMTLYRYRLPNDDWLNPELKSCILETRQTDPGLQASNVGGWHSACTLHDWPSETVGELMSQILLLPPDATAQRYDIKAWANVNEYGHSNRLHNHAGNHNVWSGFYVVDAGDPNSGGFTVFPAEEISIEPVTGMVFMFPADRDHEVEPYTGERPRITIAFNLRRPPC
jgi:hypothetical protein